MGIYSWKRPKDIPIPTVWHRFEMRDLDNKLVSYHVQDLPLERKEECLKLFITQFLADEPMCNSKDISMHKDSVDEICDLWRTIIDQNIVLACFMENSNEIIGINLVAIVQQSDVEKAYRKSVGWKAIADALDYIMSKFDIFDHYKVDKFMVAYGLLILRQYRGRNLGVEILKARFALMKAIDVRVTSTIFTNLASQIVAKKAGFEENFSISYEDLAKVRNDFAFQKVLPSTKYIKLMSYYCIF